MSLTIFQLELERCVTEILQDSRVKILEHCVEGSHEKYIRVRIEDPRVDLFLYEDEAGIQGRDIDLRYEAAEFLNPQDLVSEFSNDVRQLIMNREH